MRLFQRDGRFTSNLMSGAVGSTAWIAPSTLQNSPLEFPDSPEETSDADTTVAPFVGRPMDAAAILDPMSATQRFRAVRGVVCDGPWAEAAATWRPHAQVKNTARLRFQ